MSITLYGIKNCDSVRAARRWLDDKGVDYHFHDIREQAIAADQWQAWLDRLGETLLNKRSTTWKQLSPAQRDGLDVARAAPLLVAHPTLMKRPLLDAGGELHLGFNAEQYQSIFTHHTL